MGDALQARIQGLLEEPGCATNREKAPGVSALMQPAFRAWAGFSRLVAQPGSSRSPWMRAWRASATVSRS